MEQKEITMKDTQLIKNLKSEMSHFLGMHPEDTNHTFEEYFKFARTESRHKETYIMFLERYAENMAVIASIIPPIAIELKNCPFCCCQRLKSKSKSNAKN